MWLIGMAVQIRQHPVTCGCSVTHWPSYPDSRRNSILRRPLNKSKWRTHSSSRQDGGMYGGTTVAKQKHMRAPAPLSSGANFVPICWRMVVGGVSPLNWLDSKRHWIGKSANSTFILTRYDCRSPPTSEEIHKSSRIYRRSSHVEYAPPLVPIPGQYHGAIPSDKSENRWPSLVCSVPRPVHLPQPLPQFTDPSKFVPRSHRPLVICICFHNIIHESIL
ncbi:hypothetical protein J6590_012230 [Homalodisca vitripennis]|nr:hypothetical protein J6590_012230 [Homalodisca vitripennis]